MEREPNAVDCTRHPVDILHEEHALILKVLAALETQANILERSFDVRVDFWMRALDWLEHYADQAHNGKEEQVVFVELERAGAASREHGLLRQTLEEHEQSRTARSMMLSALASQDVPGLVRATLAYVQLVRRIIEHEEDVLFPLALEQFDEAALERTRDAFTAHERSQGLTRRERLRRIAADLTRGDSGDPA